MRGNGHVKLIICQGENLCHEKNTIARKVVGILCLPNVCLDTIYRGLQFTQYVCKSQGLFARVGKKEKIYINRKTLNYVCWYIKQ